MMTSYPMQWMDFLKETLIGSFSSRKEMQKELSDWKQRCFQLESDLLFKKAYIDEFQKKKALLTRHAPAYTTQLEQVLAVNRFAHIALITSHPHMKKGQIVINEKGIVGSIDLVSPTIARVRLLTHKEFRLPVLGEKSKQQCIIAGSDEKDSLLLLYHQDLNPLHKTERLLTSGYGGMCPAGYPVGLWDKEKLRPAIDIDALDYVQVIMMDSKNSPFESLEIELPL